jgi:sugar/nucleoside kinase (ribokinase family)
VVVLGDVATDVVARLGRSPRPGSDTAADIRMTGGGAGANVARWLRHAGADVTLVARVGDDGAGRAHVASLRAAGVRDAITVDAERPTGVVIVLVEPSGERTMLPDRGANLALSAADVPAGLLGHASHLHLSGYALLDPGPRDAALHALREALHQGLSTSVDASSAGPLRDAGPQAFLGWTAGTGLLRANLEEARVLAGEPDADTCADALAKRYAGVVVTSGAGGAVWAGGGRRWHVPTTSTTVRDSTGAGDAFTAGLLAAHLRGASPREALARGAALAARALGVPGAQPPGAGPPRC